MGFDIAPRTIIFKEASGEPIIVKVSEVDRFLAKRDYVENFTEAKRINIRRIRRQLRELLTKVKELPDLKTCRDAPGIYQASSDRLSKTLKSLTTKAVK